MVLMWEYFVLLLVFTGGYFIGGSIGFPFIMTTKEARRMIEAWEKKYGTKDGRSILDDFDGKGPRGH
jgi:hypothetical protein